MVVLVLVQVIPWFKLPFIQDGGINVNLKGILRLEHTLVANDQARFRVIFYAVSAVHYPLFSPEDAMLKTSSFLVLFVRSARVRTIQLFTYRPIPATSGHHGVPSI